jgi:hypothetical protein
LFWRTEGRGIQDVGVIEKVSFENIGASGQKEFKFTAPNGPYSCSGELISIVWALELAMTKGIIDKDAVRKEITISPTGQKIILCAEPISDSTKNVSKSVLGRLKDFFATTR